MPTSTQSQNFANALVPDTQEWLDLAVEFIKDNFSPEDIFNDDQLRDWASRNNLVSDDTD